MLLGEEGLNHNPLNTMSYLSFPLQSNAAQIAGGTLLALLAFAPLFAGELEPSLRSAETSNPQSLSTQIDHVVVYQQGAQVERVAPVKLNPGLTTVIFSKLNTAIDPAQLRLTGDGDFQVLSISHRYQTDTLSGATTASRVRELQRQSSKLQKKIGPIEARKLIFNREEQLLLNNQGFTVKDSGVDLERLMQASTFFRERFEAIQKGRLEIDTEISRIQEEIADLNAAMQALPNLQTETFLEILVNVDAVKATNGEMLLSYWMNNAGWNPSYNARVSEITEPLKLEYQALVYQNTGEEWGDVGLSIATGTPSKNRSKPQLQPWSLDGRQGLQAHSGNANAWLKSQPYNPNVREIRGQLYDASGQPLIGARVAAGSNAATTDINGFYSLSVPQGVSQVMCSSIGHTMESINISDPVMNIALAPAAEVLSEITVSSDEEREALFSPRARRRASFDTPEQMTFAPVTIEHNPTQTRFDVDARYTIPSDGKSHAVRVLEHQLSVDYLYQCTPKLDQQVYLTALFSDWEELDLINGRMHIYFEDDYVGESQLKLDFAEDTLSISLGPDPAIQVRKKRTAREDRTSLISGKREQLREYVFTISNRKKAPIHIQVDDQLPIANNEDIEINRLKLDGAEVEKDSGRVIWDLEVPAGQEEKRTFRFEIKTPKELYVQFR